MPLATGDLLQNRYRIEGPLGQGGMGTVYLAADRNLFGKLCAIKENAFTEQLAQEQFKLQARLLSQLSHPHLPSVTDHFIEPDGRQYLVTRSTYVAQCARMVLISVSAVEIECR